MSDENSSNITKSLGEILSGASIAFLGAIGSRLAGLAEKVLVARFLDPERYGLVVLSVVILSLGSTLSGLGLNQGIVRYLPRFEDIWRKRGVVMFSLQTTTLFSVLIGASTYLTADFISINIFSNHALKPVIRIFALGIPLITIAKISGSTAQGIKDATWMVFLNNIVFPFTRIGIIVLFALIGLSTLNVAYAYVFGWGTAAAIGIYYVHSRIDIASSYNVDKRTLLRFSLPLWFAGGMAFISNSIDTVLLGYFLTAERIGIYNAAYPLANLVLVAPSMIGTLLTPIMSEYHVENDLTGMRSLYSISTRWVGILTLPGFFLMALTPETFIRAVFGAEYTGGALSMLIVASGFLVFVLLGNNGSVVSMIGETDVIMLTNILNAGANLALNVLLIPKIGIKGAAIATAVSYAVSNLMVSAYLYHETRIHPFTTSLVGAGLLIALISVLVFEFVSPHLTGFALILTVYATTLVIFSPLYVFSNLVDEAELTMMFRIVRE